SGRYCLHAPGPRPSGRSQCGDVPANVAVALTERGLGSCVEISIAGYPEIVRAQLAIPTELSILWRLAVGYPDPELINCTSAGSPSGRTWFSSTPNSGKTKGHLDATHTVSGLHKLVALIQGVFG